LNSGYTVPNSLKKENCSPSLSLWENPQSIRATNSIPWIVPFHGNSRIYLKTNTLHFHHPRPHLNHTANASSFQQSANHLHLLLLLFQNLLHHTVRVHDVRNHDLVQQSWNSMTEIPIQSKLTFGIWQWVQFLLKKLMLNSHSESVSSFNQEPNGNWASRAVSVYEMGFGARGSPFKRIEGADVADARS
jgi:hypothetical protein